MLLLYLIFSVKNYRLRICKQIALQIFGSNLRTNIFKTNYLRNVCRPALSTVSSYIRQMPQANRMYSRIECSVSWTHVSSDIFEWHNKHYIVTTDSYSVD